MNSIPTVTRAEYRGRYRLYLVFDDGCEKTVDFREWLRGPIFEPLKNLRYFRRFFLDGWTVAWPNGADIAPETLYEAPDVGDHAARRNTVLATGQRWHARLREDPAPRPPRQTT